MNKASVLLRCIGVSVVFVILSAADTVNAATPHPLTLTDREVEELKAEAAALQRAGDFEAAYRVYDGGYRRARKSKQKDYAAQFAFSLARTAQGIAPGQNPEVRSGFWEIAERYYKLVLKVRPHAGSAHNNLAEVYRAWGRYEKAERHYRAAAFPESDSLDFFDALSTGATTQYKTVSGRKTLYIENLANFLAERGEWEKAVPMYRLLVLAQPQTRKYHRAVMSFYLEQPEGLTDYLWTLEESGQIRRAQQAALDGLESGAGSNKQKTEWITAFVAALARERLNPEEFTETDRGQRLGLLVDDSDVGRGVSQALLLLRGENWDRKQYQWWVLGNRNKDPPRGIWSEDSFLRLTLKMADWYRRTERSETAERCLEMANTLVPDKVDPAALSDLADLYIERGDRDAMDSLLMRYENELFDRKGDLYRGYKRRSQKEKILEFHAVLGKIYAHAGDTGDPGTAMTARFQLEQAQKMANVLETQYPDDSAAPRFNAELTGLLARVYADAGDQTRADKVRLQTADRYQRIGDSRTAKRLVDQVPRATTYSVKAYPNLEPFIMKELKDIPL